jgi:hypothetical protein
MLSTELITVTILKPVLSGATEIVTKDLRKNLEAIPGKHSIDSLQKRAIFGTSHVIRKVLQCETRILSGGERGWFRRSTRKNRPVTREDKNIIIIIIIIIGIAIPDYSNVDTKETDKQGKYKVLAFEINRMWKVR